MSPLEPHLFFVNLDRRWLGGVYLYRFRGVSLAPRTLQELNKDR